MNIKVTKITNIDNLHRMAGATIGKESKMTLATAYRNKHSIIRTQWFEVQMTDIPLFVASQLVRQTQGVQWFQKSKRTDRGGKDFRMTCFYLGERLDKVYNHIDDDMCPDEFDFVYKELTDIKFDISYLPIEFDRYAPTDLSCQINAEALMNMASKRLCSKASRDTREIVSQICELVGECDPDLYPHLVPQCIQRGGICPECKPCGYNKNIVALDKYKSLFQ